MKITLTLLLLLGSIRANCQIDIPESCKVQLNKFQKDSIDEFIKYPNLDLQISFVASNNEIDTITQIISANDTIERFKDDWIKDFEETFPILEIADYQLLLKMDDMLDDDARKKEYQKLERTYTKLKPHLLGFFSEGLALVKCPKGYNFIDKKGDLLFECFFENATNFIDGKAKVKYYGKWYKVDVKGQFYIL